jgi:hypothetical protein
MCWSLATTRGASASWSARSLSTAAKNAVSSRAPGPGGHDAVLVVAELGEHDLEVAVGFVFGDLGEQLALGAAGPGSVAFGRGDAHVLERDLRGEQPAWPVGQLVCQGPAQHPQGKRSLRDRGEPQSLAGGAVDPGPERGSVLVTTERWLALRSR